MTVTPENEDLFEVISREPFLPGTHPILWDGRRPDGSIIDVVSDVWFEVPITLRPHYVIVEGGYPRDS